MRGKDLHKNGVPVNGLEGKVFRNLMVKNSK